MENCIFCKIINGEIPSSKVYEDEHILAFRDINPQAPVHIILIPKKHISSANEINTENSHYMAKIFEAVGEIAEKEGLSNGYRLINNCGKEAGQTVFHIHIHLLGGIDMGDKLI